MHRAVGVHEDLRQGLMQTPNRLQRMARLEARDGVMSQFSLASLECRVLHLHERVL